MTYQLTDPQYAVDTDGTVRGWDVLTCDGSDEGVKVTFVAVIEPDWDERGPRAYVSSVRASAYPTSHVHRHAGRFVIRNEDIREGCVRAWKRWNDSFGGE